MTRGAADPGFDPYKALRIDPDADDEIIQVVYRRLARKYHPDVAPGPEAAARMVELNTAMEILGDPDRRAAYDRARRAAIEPGAPSSPAAGAGRTSAHDQPGPPSSRAPAPGSPRPQTVSADWTSGRSNVGGGYDPGRMRTADGHGAAGRPPGHPSGSVLNFGRYAGWSLGEIARRDLEYLEWLDRMAIGRAYREEVDALLRQAGRRRSATVDEGRRGLFRRR